MDGHIFIAIKKSKGKYLAFIDSDVIWKKNKLLTQLNFMKKMLITFHSPLTV